MKEHDLQAQILDALRFAGFQPYHTSAYRQKGSSGVAKGVPDILIPIPGWPCLLGWEIKRPGKVKWSSPEQEEAFILGHFDLIQSLEDGAASLARLAERVPSATLAHMVGRFANIAKQAVRT